MPEPSRRGFLGMASAGLGVLATAAAGIPVLGALLTPLIKPRAKQSGAFIKVASMFDLETGVPRRVDVTASAVDGWSLQADAVIGSAWLMKQADGRVVAFSTVCPHLGCPISLAAQGGEQGGVTHAAQGKFRCPCHDSYFGLDGSLATGPSLRGMDTLDVRVDGDAVSLRYVRYKQGVKDKQEV